VFSFLSLISFLYAWTLGSQRLLLRDLARKCLCSVASYCVGPGLGLDQDDSSSCNIYIFRSADECRQQNCGKVGKLHVSCERNTDIGESKLLQATLVRQVNGNREPSELPTRLGVGKQISTRASLALGPPAVPCLVDCVLVVFLCSKNAVSTCFQTLKAQRSHFALFVSLRKKKKRTDY